MCRSRLSGGGAGWGCRRRDGERSVEVGGVGGGGADAGGQIIAG